MQVEEKPRVGTRSWARNDRGRWGILRLVNPNPPRLITVVIAVVLLVIGAILALPIDQATNLLDPLAKAAAPLGIHFDRQLGYIALLVGNLLLIAGSLLPGI